MNLGNLRTNSNFTRGRDGKSDFRSRSGQTNKANYSGAERRNGTDRRSGIDAQIGRSIRIRFGSKYAYVPKSMERRSGIDRRRSL